MKGSCGVSNEDGRSHVRCDRMCDGMVGLEYESRVVVQNFRIREI